MQLCCNAALLGVLTATVFEFHKVSPDAAYLLLPYLGWSTFAAVLTLDIWRKNPKVCGTAYTTSFFNATSWECSADILPMYNATLGQSEEEGSGVNLSMPPLLVHCHRCVYGHIPDACMRLP